MKFVNVEWDIYLKKLDYLLNMGLDDGDVTIYDDALIDNLRNIYIGEIPASIIIMMKDYCNGLCLYRSLLIAAALQNDNFKLIKANTNTLRKNPELIAKAEYNDNQNFYTHYFIEYIDETGDEWIYDTSLMFKIDKELYYDMENPEIIEIIKPTDVYEYTLFKDIINNKVMDQQYKLSDLKFTQPTTIQDILYQGKLRNEFNLLNEQKFHKKK